jgi:hypothetical protein
MDKEFNDKSICIKSTTFWHGRDENGGGFLIFNPLIKVESSNKVFKIP